MFTLLAFLIVILGGINWLMIGMLQYDFVAGWFGYQGSIFSRLLYILVGISTLFLLFKAFADRGKINLINFRFSRKRKKEDENYNKIPARANIEASRDFETPSNNQNIDKYENFNTKREISGKDFSENDITSNIQGNETPQKNNIFDEMS